LTEPKGEMDIEKVRIYEFRINAIVDQTRILATDFCKKGSKIRRKCYNLAIMINPNSPLPIKGEFVY
jgi:hypothetical protein